MLSPPHPRGSSTSPPCQQATWPPYLLTNSRLTGTLSTLCMMLSPWPAMEYQTLLASMSSLCPPRSLQPTNPSSPTRVAAGFRGVRGVRGVGVTRGVGQGLLLGMGHIRGAMWTRRLTANKMMLPCHSGTRAGGTTRARKEARISKGALLAMSRRHSGSRICLNFVHHRFLICNKECFPASQLVFAGAISTCMKVPTLREHVQPACPL